MKASRHEAVGHTARDSVLGLREWEEKGMSLREQLTSSREHRAMEIYDGLREAHRVIKKIWSDQADIIGKEPWATWESALDAVDNTLYLAESFFVNIGKK
jgi:hypothetical protein